MKSYGVISLYLSISVALSPHKELNTYLVNGCLQLAKSQKSSCYIAFLDVSKAFDSIGHEHLRQSLNNIQMPENLRNLIISLISNNTIQVEAAYNKSKSIEVEKGEPQGSSLSPTLFNLAIDHIIKDLMDESVSEEYGFSISQNLSKLSCMAFADDIALISKNKYGIQNFFNMPEIHLSSLESKIIKWTFISFAISLNGNIIHSLTDPNEHNRYLGVNFNEEIVFDEALIIKNLHINISKLVILHY